MSKSISRSGAGSAASGLPQRGLDRLLEVGRGADRGGERPRRCAREYDSTTAPSGQVTALASTTSMRRVGEHPGDRAEQAGPVQGRDLDPAEVVADRGHGDGLIRPRRGGGSSSAAWRANGLRRRRRAGRRGRAADAVGLGVGRRRRRASRADGSRAATDAPPGEVGPVQHLRAGGRAGRRAGRAPRLQRSGGEGDEVERARTRSGVSRWVASTSTGSSSSPSSRVEAAG